MRRLERSKELEIFGQTALDPFETGYPLRWPARLQSGSFSIRQFQFRRQWPSLQKEGTAGFQQDLFKGVAVAWILQQSCLAVAYTRSCQGPQIAGFRHYLAGNADDQGGTTPGGGRV